MIGEDRSVLARPAPPPDATLLYGSERDQVIDAWFARRRADDVGAPLVVLVHGGFWRPEHDRLHLRPMALALRDAGRDVASIEYRRHPGDPDATVADVTAALAALPRLVADAHPAPRPSADVAMIVAGHSAGGHLALWAAAQTPAGLAGSLALAPVADLRLAHELDLDGGAVAAFLGVPPEQRGDLDPVRMVPAVPVTVVHGTVDARVPLAVSASYAAAHTGIRFVPVPEADHFSLIDPHSAAWPLVTDELALLAAPGSVRGDRPDPPDPR